MRYSLSNEEETVPLSETGRIVMRVLMQSYCPTLDVSIGAVAHELKSRNVSPETSLRMLYPAISSNPSVFAKRLGFVFGIQVTDALAGHFENYTMAEMIDYVNRALATLKKTEVVA